MKNISCIVSSVILCSISVNLVSQIALPYNTGFDNAGEQSGWVEYKKAATTFSNWGVVTSGYSAPNCIRHDYSPSTGIGLTDNWYVSPGFNTTDGAMLDSVRHMFPGLSSPLAGDTLAIYQLIGSPDPDLASQVILLVDFRGSNYINDANYRVTTDVVLVASSEVSYLAMRYRNSDCSSNWLTVLFDNIGISSATSVGNLKGQMTYVNFFPNPAQDVINMKTAGLIQTVEIMNSTGNCVYMKKHIESATHKNDLSNLPKGLYFINVYTTAGRANHVLIKH